MDRVLQRFQMPRKQELLKHIFLYTLQLLRCGGNIFLVLLILVYLCLRNTCSELQRISDATKNFVVVPAMHG